MSRTILFCSVLITLFLSSSAQSCQNYAFTSNRAFSTCSDLPRLNSFLHWTYDPASGTAQIAYRHTGITSSRWVVWAINPNSTGMVGSQALVALLKSDGSMNVYTSSVDSYQTQLQKGELSFDVSDLSATHSNNEIVIFATVTLPNNSTTVNQVWQDGPVSNDAPAMHATSGANVQSMATLNLLSGESAASGGSGAASSKLTKMNIHGVLNVVSWGIMMPIGVMIARYVKVFESGDPAWFYLHAGCQTSAYIIGVAGWATGMQLGNGTPGVTQPLHRTLGIIIFSLATLQVFALFLRPNKDNKYRPYWNVYHHLIGYTIIILSIINIFRGLDILKPANKWEQSYIGIIVSLGLVAVLLELYTWTIVLKRKKAASLAKAPVGTSGTNGFYGYGDRTQNVV